MTSSNCAAVLQANDCAFLRRALQRCEQHSSYGDILCTINGLVARLEGMGSLVSASLYLLGMRYACLSLSAAALLHHLEGYHHVSSEPLGLETSISLVSCLFHALQANQFGNQGFSTAPMLKAVTGEGGTHDGYKLHDTLFWADWEGPTDTIHPYILLLTKLKSCTILQQALERSLRALFPDSRFPGQSIYTCVMGLVDEGESEQAVTYMRRISERCDDSLPGISKFYRLRDLLADEKISELLPKVAGEFEYAEILRSQLLGMERRLGIKWQPRKSIHTSITDQQRVTSEEPLLTLDGDCAGFDSTDRLIAEIRALGCSRKLGELGRIAELLDEHDGAEIPVTLSAFEDEPSELAWCPQRSPIEFSNALLLSRHDSSVPWSPSTLGLLRGRFDSEGTPLEYERSLHLMQLGYLVMRPQGHKVRPGAHSDGGWRGWQETGHIVAWDRVAGEFLAVFVGKGHGLIDPGLASPSLQPPPGLRAVGGICVPGHFPGPRAGSGVRDSRFHFELGSL